MRVVINEAVIADLRRQPSTKTRDVWDITVRGLVLRILPSGLASWAVRAWTAEGKRTSIKIGEHPVIKITDARKLALIQLGEVQKGADPVEARRAARRARLEARRAASSALTVEQAMVQWQRARIYAPDSPWSQNYAYRIESALRAHIPTSLRKQPLAVIRRDGWTKLLSEVAQEKPGAGAFLYTITSSFLGYADAMGWIEGHPLPRRGRAFIAPHVPARTRVLEDAEWLAVWKAAEAEPVKLRVFIRLLLLTACRVSEVADMAVGEVVASGTIWVIPASRTKNGREHVVPLGPLAQQELQLVWPADARNHGDYWMLLGRSPTHGFVGNGKLLRRLFQTSKTANWTWHDLRRTARTGMTYLGVSEAAAEAALNHITGKSKLVAIYDHSGPSTSGIAALRTWQGYVADVVDEHRKPGEAETSYRESLPEDLRWRSRQKFIPRQKAKPGRGASRRTETGTPLDSATTPRPRKRRRESLVSRAEPK